MPIKVTKLPKDLDVDCMFRKAVLDTYRRCPYCHEKTVKDMVENFRKEQERWKTPYPYGTFTEVVTEESADKKCLGEVEPEIVYTTYKSLNGKSGIFTKRQYRFAYMEFTCKRCGMVWQSPEYPTGLCADEQACQTIFDAYMQGKNVDTNAMLIPILKKARTVND